MDNYIVSARKYRPDSFNSVVGQESITTTLKNAIKTGQLAQAFLFCGPRGVGKTTCARILSKTINCMSPTENMEACNECESCKSFNNNASFNIHELDAASNNSVQDIRNLVDQVRIPPQVGKYKIYIIDEVHMLSQAAFNAFLKTLEEPPAYAKFILATTEKNKIIPTILSRCQIFDFKRITVEDIVNHLKYVAKAEKIKTEDQALHTIATKSDGGMRDALSLFDQMVAFCGKNITYKNVIKSLNVLDYEYYFKITDYILQNDIKNVLLTINEIFDNGFEGQTFITGFNEHLRNLLVAKNPETLNLLLESENIKNRYKEQAANCKESVIVESLNTMTRCDVDYRQSNNKHLLIEVALINICYQTVGIEKKKDELGYEINVPQSSEFRKKITSENSNTIKQNDDNNTTSNKIDETVTETEIKEISKTKKIEDKTEHRKAPKVKSTKIKSQATSIKISNISLSSDEDSHYTEPRKNEYTLEDVIESISSFIDQIDTTKILIRNILKNNINITLCEENIVQIECSNAVNEQEVKNYNQEMVSFLRNKLQNDLLNIKTKVTEIETKEVIITNKDKFKEMAKKNKELLNMQKQLNLKISY